MQAMGFNKERGDSLTVVNSSFAGEPVEIIPEVPIWKKPEMIEYGKDALRFIVGIVVLLMIYKKALKPILNKLMTATPKRLEPPPSQEAIADMSGDKAAIVASASQQNLGAARQLAKDNPRMVANVVSTWTNG
jgi:flagellar M-ring protein FliF